MKRVILMYKNIKKEAEKAYKYNLDKGINDN